MSHFPFQAVRLDGPTDPATLAITHLRRIAGPDAVAVRAHMDGDTVRLTGRVAGWHLKQLATSTVRNVAPTVTVANDLRVG